ncbi:MAG: hypothetical protein LCI00_15405 [Chloroflexi bacterium]|nr:hypothetical protein [Chloroflexota bacterium]
MLAPTICCKLPFSLQVMNIEYYEVCYKIYVYLATGVDGDTTFHKYIRAHVCHGKHIQQADLQSEQRLHSGADDLSHVGIGSISHGVYV